MKLPQRIAVALLSACHVAECVRQTIILNTKPELSALGKGANVAVHEVLHENVHGHEAVQDAVHGAVHKTETGLKATVKMLIGEYLEGKQKMKLRDIIHTATDKITFEEALQHMDDKNLPEDVASLVRMTKGDAEAAAAGSKKQIPTPPFSEDSIQKARRILNQMVSDAWLELDNVLFESKEFEGRNRGTFEQVMNDLSRLGAQLANLGEKRIAANAGIESYDQQRTDLEGIFEKTTQDFTAQKTTNEAELQRRKNDLAVFDFILNMTRCKEGQAFMQVLSDGHGRKVEKAEKVQICSTKDDGFELRFDNPRLQHQIEKMMTPEARLALRAALGQVAGPALLEVSSGNTTSSPFVAQVVPVSEEPHPAGQWKKCVDGEENCGLLHDLMSLEWGKFRDDVDELTATMLGNQQAYDAEVSNYNQQFTVISDAKTKSMETLAQAVSDINADQAESDEKEEQKRELEEQFAKEMATFRATITEILFTKICAVRKVRNGIAAHSTLSPPTAISDCDVSDWVSKTGQCFSPAGLVITCDNECPKADPYQCGGTEVMKRDVVVLANEYGIVCPALERSMRCGQKKCEVNCAMSQWSSWSACSKDCGGGVQVKTRSIITKAKHGGMGCDAPQEERACHTGSCDRNCALDDWTRWDFCSMACGTGMTTRTRSVLVPIRGQGTCPAPNHVDRLEEETCNTQACVGDEICVARQDLVIALDASGSLKQGGFEILRTFAANLTKRYKANYFGSDSVRMGLVVFGNGHLVYDAQGETTTSQALSLQPLTDDFAVVKTTIEATTWQRGYTNMAQAFHAADVMLATSGRANAQSAVLVISDGRYSMKYQTMEKARELKDKNTKIFMGVVSEFASEELAPLQQMASQPWETNFEVIPGLAALKENNGLYVDKFIAKFCPDSKSPSAMQAQDASNNYMMIHENGWPDAKCGTTSLLSTVNTRDECAEAVRQLAQPAFAFGRGTEAGKCRVIHVLLDQAWYDQYMVAREIPPCPTVGGAWEANPYYDTFAIDPRSMGV